jgi:hypothetical protein
MRKTLLTIATVGLLSLSSMTGAFAQGLEEIQAAMADVVTNCGAGGNPTDCLNAVLAVKVALVAAEAARVTLPTALVFNGITIAPAGIINSDVAVDAYQELVTQVEATPQGLDPAIAGALDLEAALEPTDFGDSTSRS